MVAILEIEKKYTKKEQWKKWWKIEGKIESVATVISLAIVIPLWNHSLTFPIFCCFVAIWSFGKIYFRRDKWALLFILGLFFLYRGLSGLLSFYR